MLRRRKELTEFEWKPMWLSGDPSTKQHRRLVTPRIGGKQGVGQCVGRASDDKAQDVCADVTLCLQEPTQDGTKSAMMGIKIGRQWPFRKLPGTGEALDRVQGSAQGAKGKTRAVSGLVLGRTSRLF